MKIFNKLKSFQLNFTYFSNVFSTNTRRIVKLDSVLDDNLTKEEVKAKRHPGIHNSRCIALPKHIQSAIIKSTKDSSINVLIEEGKKLNRYLNGRHVPLENKEIFKRQQEIENNLFRDLCLDPNLMTKSERTEIIKANSGKLLKKFKNEVYSWRPIQYDTNKSLAYAVGCSSQEYSVIYRILCEIQKRDGTFNPRSFFDFGAGVGTGTWAVSQLWKNSIFEYFLVDSSRDMNDLSELILSDGDANKNIELKNVFYRQFLPATPTKYDIVLCAYTLFDLENLEKRLDTLRTLWNKCENYFIIIERGTYAGFTLITEARNYLLKINAESNDCHVFAPCPHDLDCPRYFANDGTPCNFETSYLPLTVNENDVSKIRQVRYSYVVLRKGSRATALECESYSWPRIIRKNLLRSKHSICRICSSHGQLDEIIFTKSKHGKNAYNCAKYSKWGDRLPIEVTAIQKIKDESIKSDDSVQ